MYIISQTTGQGRASSRRPSLWQRFSNWMGRVDTAIHLESLDDALLRDMGLTRDSIKHAIRYGKLD